MARQKNSANPSVERSHLRVVRSSQLQPTLPVWLDRNLLPTARTYVWSARRSHTPRHWCG